MYTTERSFRPVPAAPSASLARGAGSRQAARSRASVDRLLTVASRLFIARGFDGTTVEQIASGAGLTKGALYFHFANKADVLIRLLDEAEKFTVIPVVEAVREAGESAHDRLVAFLHAQSLVGREHADRMMLVILMSIELNGTPSPAQQRVAEIAESMFDVVVDIVDLGRSQGTFRAEVPTTEMAGVVMAIVQGCFVEWYRRGERFDGEQFVRALRTTVLGGVLTPASPVIDGSTS